MKKYKTKLLAMLAAAVLLAGSLAACGNSASSTPVQPPSTNGDGSAVATTGEPEALTLPLTDEPITLTVYIRNQTSGIISNYAEIRGFQEIAAATGVNLEFIHPTTGSENEQFNLMIAGGEYPDIIIWEFNNTALKLNGLIEDGIVIDMDPLIRQYAPDYLAYLEQDEDLMRQALNDDGKLAAMYKLEPEPARQVTNVLSLRGDLLEKYNLDVPETIDDWYNVLTTIKENEPGVTAPFGTAKGYRDGVPRIEMFMGAFETYYQHHPDTQTGSIVYGPATENYRAYLTVMNQWYAEGLIDPEYMTNDLDTYSANWSSGKTVAGHMAIGRNYSGFYRTVRSAGNEDWEMIGVPWPVLNKGDTQYIMVEDMQIRVGNMAGAITNACADPVLAVKLLDYMNTDDGRAFLEWGVEGESYEVDAQGNITFTETVTNDPSLTTTEALYSYALPGLGLPKPMNFEAWRQLTLEMPQQQAAHAVASVGSTALHLPALSMDTQTNDEYTRIMTEVETYVAEMSVRFITGQSSIETDFDTYISTLNGMGLETATGYVQDAYDRFLAR